MMRPGRSTMCRIERAVTLFPQPLSPTIPSVWLGFTSKLAPSTALIIPSSEKKYVLRSRTARRDGEPFPVSWEFISHSHAIGISRIAKAVSHEIEGQHGDDHRNCRIEEP